MKKLSAKKIDKVLKYLPYFADPKSKPFWTVDDCIMDPYRYSEEVHQFEQTLYREGFMFPFDWGEWRDTAKELVEDPARLDTADLETLRKLMTLHIRQERFCSGHLASMIECGNILNILRRLAEIRRATSR